MKIADLASTGKFRALAEAADLNREISGCYISDLLSWVMGHAKTGNCWITIMGHINIVAIASLLELACIVVCEGGEVEASALEKAKEEGIAIFSTDLSSFEAARLLISLGL
jgi:hypothetical protein